MKVALGAVYWVRSAITLYEKGNQLTKLGDVQINVKVFTGSPRLV